MSGDSSSASARSDAPPVIDTSVAHIARVYNYWLGGTTNYPADREAAQQAMAAYPDLALSARANRAFLARTVRWLTGRGIRQFLDIGTGIPTKNNTHEVAQAIAPGSRVVYVDHDPIVLAHARSLLTSSPEGATDYLDADLRRPGEILTAAARTLDLGQPVAIVLMAVLQFVMDEDRPADIVAELLDAVPSGSYLVVSHPASDINAASMRELAERLNRLMVQRVALRSRAEVTRFFDGLDLVDPGLVQLHRWRPGSGADTTRPLAAYGAVARKP
jgi:SAM-dependent methyltransferase